MIPKIPENPREFTLAEQLAMSVLAVKAERLIQRAAGGDAAAKAAAEQTVAQMEGLLHSPPPLRLVKG